MERGFSWTLARGAKPTSMVTHIIRNSFYTLWSEKIFLPTFSQYPQDAVTLPLWDVRIVPIMLFGFALTMRSGFQNCGSRLRQRDSSSTEDQYNACSHSFELQRSLRMSHRRSKQLFKKGIVKSRCQFFQRISRFRSSWCTKTQQQIQVHR